MRVNCNVLKNHYIAEKSRHPFHMVDPSPWPIFLSLALLNLVLSLSLYFHGVTAIASGLILSLVCVCSFLIEVNITFFPMHFLGLAVMLSMVPDYATNFFQ